MDGMDSTPFQPTQTTGITQHSLLPGGTIIIKCFHEGFSQVETVMSEDLMRLKILSENQSVLMIPLCGTMTMNSKDIGGKWSILSFSVAKMELSLTETNFNLC